MNKPALSQAAMAHAYLDSLPADLMSGRPQRPRLGGYVRNAVADAQPAGYVDDGSLVSFVGNVLGQSREDVLNSTLLAQAAADAALKPLKQDRFNNMTEWYKQYVSCLGKVGWVIQDFDFTQYAGGGTTVTMDKVVLELLAAIATEEGVAVVKATMDALKALGDNEKGLRLFDHASQSLNKGTFQVGVANAANNALTFSTSALSFASSKSETKFLWFGYSTSDIKIFTSAQSMTLNQDAYAQVRGKIITKLGDRANNYLDQLDLGDF